VSTFLGVLAKVGTAQLRPCPPYNSLHSGRHTATPAFGFTHHKELFSETACKNLP
jgi:hypothetical protein